MQHTTCYHPGMPIGDVYQLAVGKFLPADIMRRLRVRRFGKDYGYEDQVPTWETMPCKSRMCILPS